MAEIWAFKGYEIQLKMTGVDFFVASQSQYLSHPRA
jgi:hypothetical protein